MRFSPVILLLCASLTGCTLLQPEKALVRGSVWLVSQADIHKAIVEARAGNPALSQAPVSEVIVDSRSVLSISFDPDDLPYVVARRVNGRWYCIYIDPAERVIVD